MENKDNIFKLIIRILIFGFILFSIYVAMYHGNSNNSYLIIPYVIGFFSLIGLGVTLVFTIAGIGVFLLFRLLNWAFNTDYFD
jgi:hypothetical protein